MPVRPHPQVVFAVTASSLTITKTHFGGLVTNRGGGALTLTFPAPGTSNAGAFVDVVQVAAGDLVITTAGGTELNLLDNAAATSLTAGTDNEEIGNAFCVMSDGTKWLVYRYQAAEAVTDVVA